MIAALALGTAFGTNHINFLESLPTIKYLISLIIIYFFPVKSIYFFELMLRIEGDRADRS